MPERAEKPCRNPCKEQTAPSTKQAEIPRKVGVGRKRQDNHPYGAPAAIGTKAGHTHLKGKTRTRMREGVRAGVGNPA